MIRKALPFLVILFFSITLAGQEIPEAYRNYNAKYPSGPVMTNRDAALLRSLPEKKVPETAVRDQLPAIVDNSTLPYLRPVFLQEGPSCGQAAMVGYNFTYEMACKRDQPALFPQTQYPTHFTWNFQNGGDGWYGVSYFHSVEILRMCGCMNSYDYGGFFDDGRRWINGYNLYNNGMYNRVRQMYRINTSTEEGILALKHWLYNHMGEQEHGGVASYYANVPWNAVFLNDTTPEGGKYVVTWWYPLASHAMTIVGYNDSIRYDYNGDGQYTNTIDLNNDQVIDPRDWEFGGVKFVNSHGTGSQDSGFCYMMYKVLAEKFETGGIWNQEVHILDVDEDYLPLMAFKVKIKHTNRGKIKVMAGVSQDTSDISPAWMMDFPMINYQGGNHFMQGNDTLESLKTLEFGLDVTPLLGHLESGMPAKFFLVVDEDDPGYQGDGQILSFSVMDYTGSEQEYVSDDIPVDIENNSISMASVMFSPDFEIITITTDSLPPFVVDEPYSFQLGAAGGRIPYSWEIAGQYTVEQSTATMPGVDEFLVLDSAEDDTIMAVALGFDFPFYGGTYDTVFMHINGHLQFSGDQIPWPYMMEPELMFRSIPMIAPLSYAGLTIMPAEGDGGWVETSDTAAIFRWKLSAEGNLGTTDINFTVKLEEDGTIGFIYGPSTLGGFGWLAGLSAGNKTDYLVSPYSGQPQIPPGTSVTFRYQSLPGTFQLSENGLLSGTPHSDDRIHDVAVRVTDRSGISVARDFQLTSGPYIYLSVMPGNDDQVFYGDTVSLQLTLVNGGTEILENPFISLSTSDPFIIFQDSQCQTGTIPAGESVSVTDAFSFVVSTFIPDHSDIQFETVLDASGRSWVKDLVLQSNAPGLFLERNEIGDEDNRLSPGETAPLLATLRNSGHAAIDQVMSELVSLSPEVVVSGTTVQDFGSIGKGASVTRSFTLTADDSTPSGTPVTLILTTTSASGIGRQDTIEMKVGKTPVMVIDMAVDKNSGPVIFSLLQELNVIADYDYSITPKIFDYESLFICLGYYYQNHLLTLGEGTLIANYLDAGGKVYLESRTTWKDDPGTPAQPKFNIQWAGNITPFDTITGIDTAFAAGLAFINEAIHPFSFYYLDAIPPAFPILEDNNTHFPCAVAYDAGNYKTIGALFEFGTQPGIPSGASTELLTRYLEFFGIDVNPIGTDEINLRKDETELLIYPVPASNLIHINILDPVSRKPSPVIPTSLFVINLYGQTVMQIEDIQSFPFALDISALSPGLYFLRMVDEKGHSGTSKFIKAQD